MRPVLLCLLLAACAAPRNAMPAPAGHAEVVADWMALAERHRADKNVPGIWLAFADRGGDGQAVHWSGAVGVCTGEQPAGFDDRHRVASVSKLFTATAVMVLVERGVLELDAPVTRWLPGFAPHDPHGGTITLRHLLEHSSGLPRETPVGNYLDASQPTLAATVASLNDTTLLHAPGAGFSYSSPGIAVAGAVVAEALQVPFAEAMQQLVLSPLGLGDSQYEARQLAPSSSEPWRPQQSLGRMWTYDGRTIETPTYPLGYAPAANLCSTVGDLVQFAASWFPGAEPRLLRSETLQAMGSARGDLPCGLGCFVGEFDGHRRVSHSGVIQGTATELMALPDDGLAVAVVCTLDSATALAQAIAEHGLRALLAARAGRRLPLPPASAAAGVARARALAGRYRLGDEWLDLKERGGELWFDPCIGVATRMRPHEDHFVSDDVLAIGGRMVRDLGGGRVNDGIRDFVLDRALPPPCPDDLLPLLGEYGPDHGVMIVYEDGGRLSVLTEWIVRDQPDRTGPDEFRFAPGPHGGETLRFLRDGQRAVVAAVLGNVRLARRPDPDRRGFRIAPVREIADLRRQQATPPAQPAGLRAPDLVDLPPLAADLRFDLRYATADNFLGVPVYEAARAKMQRPAAMALLAAHRALARSGYGLCIFDAYRPWSVTRLFWEATPPHLHHFVADPQQGSRHNRGCAVDLTLYELATGAVVEMPSGFDEFTARAYPDWPGGTGRQRFHRELLRRAMEDAGFSVYEHEWWHFDFADWRSYPVLDEPLR